MKRKILTLLMTVVLLLSVMALAASAEDGLIQTSAEEEVSGLEIWIWTLIAGGAVIVIVIIIIIVARGDKKK